MSLPQDNTLGPWIIDDRSHYEQPAGGHQKPLELGAVIAECPTAFGGHTVRDPSTIGKPCPSKDELDRLGLAHATAIAALPELIAALESAESALTECRPHSPHLLAIRAALAKARAA